jgi:hypothetical protein
VHLDRRTCVLAGIFVLALIALIVDRWMTGGPESASAEEVERPASRTETRKPPDVAAPRAARADAAVVEPPSSVGWLNGLPDAPDVRDLFAPAKASAKAEADGAEDGTADPVAGFVASHRLEATFQDGAVGCAVVDGRVVRRGQGVDGFRLVSVDAFRAVFRRGGNEAILTMNAAITGPETRPSNRK